MVEIRNYRENDAATPITKYPRGKTEENLLRHYTNKRPLQERMVPRVCMVLGV
jgi:hypothetical protein